MLQEVVKAVMLKKQITSLHTVDTVGGAVNVSGVLEHCRRKDARR